MSVKKCKKIIINHMLIRDFIKDNDKIKNYKC